MLEKLQKLGLTEKESQIYLDLVRKGEATGNQLAKETSSHRTVAYNILQQLVDKGLVTYVKKGGRRVYSPTDPESLLADLKEKEVIAEDIIKEINSMKTVPPSEKSVEVYEGKEGLKVVMEGIRNAEDLRIINATGRIYEYLEYSAEHIVTDIELRSRPKIIGVSSMKSSPLSNHKDFEIKYLPEKADNYATTFIYEGKVVMLVLKTSPFLIQIENDEIYNGYKKDFDVLWDLL